MSNNINRRRRPRKPLQVLQINVARGAIPHELALTHAFQHGVDIILVQEPYVFHDLPRRITKKHPAFECFSPTHSWQLRPRVMTYVRKGTGLTAEQLCPLNDEADSTRDLLLLRVVSPSRSVTIINIYNAPSGCAGAGAATAALRVLPRDMISGRCLLGGDFNLHHPRWQPAFPGSSAPAQPTVDWTDEVSLCFISGQGTPTHNGGNVLDLVFASSQLVLDGVNASIAHHLDVTSDHLPLLSTIPLDDRFREHTTRLRPDTLDLNIFNTTLREALHDLPVAPLQADQTTLDRTAQILSDAIRKAYQSAAKRSTGRGTGQPWWNDECARAAAAHRRARREQGAAHDESCLLRRTVRRAKRLFYQAKLDDAATAREVFQIAGWHKSAGSFRSPPLRNPASPDDPPATSLDAKREVLITNLLQNVAQSVDIPVDSPAVPRQALPFPAVRESEIRAASLVPGSTAPGDDEITMQVFKAGWPLLQPHVIALLKACLELGHHPKCFKLATVVIIGKANKPDKSSPRAYRPIALLSVLGKSLERLVARRMSWVAIKHSVVPSQQFGALPLRSSVDLTTCLTHDVETALSSGLTASLLTLDVRGAFDGVLPGRLTRRLREQGWPENLVKWVTSFVSDRVVKIRLDGSTGPATPIQCGLPQGSPVSPILFMLYIAPLLALGDQRARYGYADDVGLLACSPSLASNADILSEHLQTALDWAASEGVAFDSAKSELMHFSRKREDSTAQLTSPPVMAGDLVVEENRTRKYLRWLGVLFDRKLTFKFHAAAQAQKAVKISKALSSLGNTVRGMRPLRLRQAVLACSMSVAYFASETWWPGRKRTGLRRPVSNRVDTLLRGFQIATHTAARAILPAFRTTPTPILHRESGLLPAEIALDSRTRRAAVRIHKLDVRHPLRVRAAEIKHLSRPTSRLARQILALPDAEQTDAIANPPWHPIEDRADSLARVGAQSGRRAAKSFFTDFLAKVPGSDIMVYSDGSKLQDGATGGGFVIYQANTVALQRSFSLGKEAEVFDAEAKAALAGLEAALGMETSRLASDLWICLDNLEVAVRLLSRPDSGSSQAIFHRFAKKAQLWRERARLPHTLPGDVRVRWVPAHVGIAGNEAADAAAKAGALLPPPTNVKHTLASLGTWTKNLLRQDVNVFWTASAPERYRALGITFYLAPPKELTLPRSVLGRLLAARSGHGDFAAYHERFGHEDAVLLCRCGSRKDPKHFFFCRVAKRRARFSPGRPETVLDEVLGTFHGACSLSKWLEKTRFFDEICTR